MGRYLQKKKMRKKKTDEQNDKLSEAIKNSSSSSVCVSVCCNAFDFPAATPVTGPIHVVFLSSSKTICDASAALLFTVGWHLNGAVILLCQEQDEMWENKYRLEICSEKTFYKYKKEAKVTSFLSQQNSANINVNLSSMLICSDSNF